jgi:hypothetical protein
LGLRIRSTTVSHRSDGAWWSDSANFAGLVASPIKSDPTEFDTPQRIVASPTNCASACGCGKRSYGM